MASWSNWSGKIKASPREINELTTDTRHFEFFWLPGHD